jgi:hypothetical protein
VVSSMSSAAPDGFMPIQAMVLQRCPGGISAWLNVRVRLKR